MYIVVLKNNSAYLVKNESDFQHSSSETDIIPIFINNVYVEFSGRVYPQTIGIPICTNLNQAELQIKDTIVQIFKNLYTRL